MVNGQQIVIRSRTGEDITQQSIEAAKDFETTAARAIKQAPRGTQVIVSLEKEEPKAFTGLKMDEIEVKTAKPQRERVITREGGKEFEAIPSERQAPEPTPAPVRRIEEPTIRQKITEPFFETVREGITFRTEEVEKPIEEVKDFPRVLKSVFAGAVVGTAAFVGSAIREPTETTKRALRLLTPTGFAEQVLETKIKFEQAPFFTIGEFIPLLFGAKGIKGVRKVKVQDPTTLAKTFEVSAKFKLPKGEKTPFSKTFKDVESASDAIKAQAEKGFVPISKQKQLRRIKAIDEKIESTQKEAVEFIPKAEIVAGEQILQMKPPKLEEFGLKQDTFKQFGLQESVFESLKPKKKLGLEFELEFIVTEIFKEPAIQRSIIRPALISKIDTAQILKATEITTILQKALKTDTITAASQKQVIEQALRTDVKLQQALKTFQFTKLDTEVTAILKQTAISQQVQKLTQKQQLRQKQLTKMQAETQALPKNIFSIGRDRKPGKKKKRRGEIQEEVFLTPRFDVQKFFKGM